MTQKELNEVHYKVEDLRKVFNEVTTLADPYTRMDKNKQKTIIEETLDVMDSLLSYLVMVTAQSEGWEPGHGTDTLKSKLDWFSKKVS